MFENYYQVRDWLESFIPLVYGKEELGLARTLHLLKLLGNPEKKFKSIHIAGTSGKGSTAYYIAQLLRNCKLETRNSKLETNRKYKKSKVSDCGFRNSNFTRPKVGLHVSPHLVDIRERMQIFRGEAEYESLMPMGRFIKLFDEIKPVVEKIKKKNPELTPSYFEILVAATFLYFAQEKVDWAVVEVGMGGRLDATNVLMPEVSVITNVGLDHIEILGKTIEKIAFEKAGIIKKKVPVVTGYPSTLRLSPDRSGSSAPPTSGGAFEVIAEVAKKQQAPLITIDTQDRLLANKLLAIEAVNLLTQGTTLTASGKFLATKTRWLPDEYQGASLSKLLDITFPGRFEEIASGVILDGAHNPDKIKFLIHWIKKQLTTNNLPALPAGRQLTKKKRSDVSGQMSVVLVLAFKKGKNWKKMVDLLIKDLPVRAVIATQFYAVTDTGKFAAVDPKEIAKYVETIYHLRSTVYSNSQEAVFEALKRAREKKSQREKELVLVTGSLYLVGEVRTMWKLPGF